MAQGKVGRPQRSKASYNSEIQRLKHKNKQLEASKDDLLAMLEGTNEAYMKYRYAGTLKRIKYVFTGDV